MHLILLLVGVLAAAAGIAMIRMAIPIEDFSGAALFTSGIVAIVGALILAGLAAAVRSLSRIAERLDIQPLPLPPIAAVGREDPAPRPVRASPPAAGTARPSLLGWLGRGGPPVPARTAPQSAPASDPAAPVDLGPLARIPENPRQPVPTPQAAQPAKLTPRPGSAQSPETTVYRSGVIDGMAYSLFMDGSIHAELPQGTVKFASVDELQKYLLSSR